MVPAIGPVPLVLWHVISQMAALTLRLQVALLIVLGVSVHVSGGNNDLRKTEIAKGSPEPPAVYFPQDPDPHQLAGKCVPEFTSTQALDDSAIFDATILALVFGPDHPDLVADLLPVRVVVFASHRHGY